jgi:hypothetical protein
MPYPDNFNTRAYAAAYERPIIAIEPPLYAATRDDIDAMQKARAWLVVALTSLRETPWEFDSTEIPPHHMLVADAEAFLEQMDKALEQARASREAW